MADASVHHLGCEESAALLRTDRERGLRAADAAQRLAHHGRNVLPAPRRPGVARRLALQFHNPLIYVLIAATAVAVALGETVDAAVIAGVVVLNAGIGFLQESRAESALEALRSVATTRAVVVRDGRRHEVDSDVLVPGDLVELEAGDRVPADVRLMAVREARIDESMLTGESATVAKRSDPVPAGTVLAERASMAYAGTLVRAGRARGLVVATGPDTELGQIHRLIGETTDLATPLTRQIAAFGRLLTVAILGLAVLTFALGVARGESAGEMFTAAVALSVAAIPEGLPAAVTITLAIGVSRMAQRRAIVRRLPAAETLGSTTVICTDKTGTLTENRMEVQAIWAAGARRDVPAVADGRIAGPHADCLVAGVLCNDAHLRQDDGSRTVVGDPTEAALLVSAARAGIAAEELRARHPRLDAVPFSSERGWMATLDRAPGGARIHAKGAVERILDRCSRVRLADGDAPLDRASVLDAAATLADEGLRVLALAVRDAGGATTLEEADVAELTLVGLQGMLDPPRPETIAAIAECRKAGVAVKMVTGDQLETARAIAARIGLAGSRRPVAISGDRLAGIDPGALADTARETDVFARVSPEQKLRLVEALQSRGHVVAMTGDGVNDAPALRQADIGTAMGRSGTEVAKEAADIVLADDDFSTIAGAVREGRRVFDNLTKFIVWTLPTNLGEGLVILVAILLGATLPMLPTQVLWVNMTTAGTLGLALAFEPPERDVMRRPPRPPGQPLLTGPIAERIVLVAAALLAAAYGLFALELHLGASTAEARTVAVNVFVVGEAFYLLNCRSLRHSFWSVGVLSNRWVLVGLGATVVLQLLFTYAPFMQRLFETEPLAPAAWLRIVVVGMAISLVVAAEKRLRARGGRRWARTARLAIR